MLFNFTFSIYSGLARMYYTFSISPAKMYHLPFCVYNDENICRCCITFSFVSFLILVRHIRASLVSDSLLCFVRAARVCSKTRKKHQNVTFSHAPGRLVGWCKSFLAAKNNHFYPVPTFSVWFVKILGGFIVIKHQKQGKLIILPERWRN